MKVGDKVTNKMAFHHGGKYYPPLTLTGKITSIDQCLYSNSGRDYMVKRYNVEWPNFKDWVTSHMIKRCRREG